MPTGRAIQDFYHADIAIRHGCGRNNPQGLCVSTYRDG